ncbi:MAG: alpha-L-arabinofuranosidase C-terminal domain-containing protein [Mangrovibacterium sp.]
MIKLKFLISLSIAVILLAVNSFAQTDVVKNVLKIELSTSKKVTPVKYGWHYEEIGMIGEGGLYAEMVRNSAFEEANPPRGLTVENGAYSGIPHEKNNPRKKPYVIDPLIGWSTIPGKSTSLKLEVVSSNPLNKNNLHALKIQATNDEGGQTYRVVNKGFFGMFFEQGKLYKLSFYLRNNGFDGQLKVFLGDSEGTAISKVFEPKNLNGEWTKYSAVFEADTTTNEGMLCFIPNGSGNLFLDLVSLFPGDTWDNGRSVFRADIMRNLIDYAPDFLRFPGGCIVHGVNVETMYHWKETIGDIAERPGAWSKWSPNYRTDGLGYHEFYELCEYLHCDAMYVAPSGLVCTAWVNKAEAKDEYDHPKIDVKEYIQDALDAIEYAIGTVDSEWGGKRAANGHPKPFPLKYISVGNEDFGPTYYRNYDAFYRTIKSKYPQLKIIANSIIGQREDEDRKRERIDEFVEPATIEIFDEHYYKNIPWVIDNYFKFDQYKRPGPDMFIGELGIAGKHPLDVLGEAIFMMGVERNADLNPLIADRPLMRNWDFVQGRGNPLYFVTNKECFKTFNYYMSKLFRDNQLDQWYESAYWVDGHKQVPGLDYLFSSAGTDPFSGDLIIKVVNLSDKDITSMLDVEGLFGTQKMQITTLDSRGGVNNTPQKPNAIYPEVSERTMDMATPYIFKTKSLTVFRVHKKV